jgi:hypothetical protein
MHSRRIWLIVPLLALWSNLHGAVLVGVAVALVYLGLVRLRARPIETVAVAAGCGLALCVNPAEIHAFAYYAGVLSNAAAQRGEGLWSPLSVTTPPDILCIAAAGILAVRAAHGRIRAWETIAVLLLAAMTVHASRSGIWLLFMLLTPATVGARPGSPWRRRVALMASASLVAIVVGALRGPALSGADSRTVEQAIGLARGTPILASDIAAEQIALAGGRVWVSNPIDAFARRIQVFYLEWLDGDRAGLAGVGTDVRVVVVSNSSPGASLMRRTPGFRKVAERRGFELFEKNG